MAVDGISCPCSLSLRSLRSLRENRPLCFPLRPSTAGEDDTALGAFNESEDLIDILLTGQLFFDLGNRLGGIELGVAHDPPHGGQGLPPILRKPLTLQTNCIRPEAPSRPVADDLHERHAVLGDNASTAEERMLTYSAELMHGGQGANSRTASNLDMTCQGRVIGKDDLRPDVAVMGDVGVGHK